jgi:hypothetical protein
MTLGASRLYRVVPGMRVNFGAEGARLSRRIMLMLRQGGKFTDGQIRKYLNKVLLGFGVAILGVAISDYFGVPLVGVGHDSARARVRQSQFSPLG